ncbi:MAG: hypothetical protein M1813_001620 [Trichoglossum hirsutum]|nr:MAG: hypothetical protein M1813_001620 [Trichoglossum hirsutum]
MSTAGDSPAATDSRPAELNDNLQELSDAPTQTSSYVLEPYPPEASNQSARGSGHQSASVSNGLSLTSRSSLSLSSPADDTPPHINPIAGPAQLQY